MKADKNGKLSYQMVSPGEAWNNFTNSKDGHNAAAVTPSYLDNSGIKATVENLSLGESNLNAAPAKPKLFKEAMTQQNAPGQKEYPLEKEEVAMEK